MGAAQSLRSAVCRSAIMLILMSDKCHFLFYVISGKKKEMAKNNGSDMRPQNLQLNCAELC